MINDNEQNMLISLGDLHGKFIIPRYQRGYRWTVEQVKDLLLDLKTFVDNFNEKLNIYFLQTLFVKNSMKNNDSLELVDGQQRLITAYLIDAVLCFFGKCDSKLNFSIECEDREDTNQLLKNLKYDPIMCSNFHNEDDIDRYHVLKAWDYIYSYFYKFKYSGDFSNYYSKFINNIHFLVAEPDDSDPVNQFKRLNMGRIPLTSSELCRALLLNPAKHNLDKELNFSEDNLKNIANDSEALVLLKAKRQRRRQLLLGTSWDNLERSLRKPDLCGFITTNEIRECQTYIDYILDLYTKRPRNSPDFYVFHKLEEKLNNINDLDAQDIWDEITLYFTKLCSWYQDNDLYHWIGYLIKYPKSGTHTLMYLLEIATKIQRSQFIEEIKKLIKDSINDGIKNAQNVKNNRNVKNNDRNVKNIDDLDYRYHPNLIKQILFLFSVEYVRSLRNNNLEAVQHFPFPFYNKKSDWTLEHIEPQNAQVFTKSKDWNIWIEEHQLALRDIQNNFMYLLNIEDQEDQEDQEQQKNSIIKQIKTIDKNCDNFLKNINNKKINNQEEYTKLSQEIIQIFGEIQNFVGKNTNVKDQKHKLGNLTLLQLGQNIYLKNSVFFVKQKKLIEAIKQGRYIPKTTELVFMRYFSDSENQLPYWTTKDNDNYLDQIKATLESILPSSFLNRKRV
ncbi:MAG: DUF262 domain-containing protein [Bacteroidales bacterium]|jgi:hypothetical protein|nr:DUF262 domain-containing protein [Bacteroidales bacterium]